MTPPKIIKACGVQPVRGPRRKRGCRLPTGHNGPHATPRVKLDKRRGQFVDGWEFWQDGGAERAFVEKIHEPKTWVKK